MSPPWSTHSPHSSSILLHKIPISSTATSTESPCFNHNGGSLANPTPSGVPVKIIDPFANVVPWLKKDINSWTLKIRSFVFEFCNVISLTVVFIFKLFGFFIFVTKHGPNGQKVSNLWEWWFVREDIVFRFRGIQFTYDFALFHWPPPFLGPCQRLALTSLHTV